MTTQLDPFAGAENLYTITVRGAMNPAIHHPAWYRLINAISPEEMALAATAQVEAGVGKPVQIQAAQGFSSAQFSVFTAGSLRITCLPEVWSIATTEASKLERITEMAGTVFAALPHTPISGYTVSFAHHRHTSLPDVGGHLARQVHSLPVGLPHVDGTVESAYIRYAASSALHDLVIDLQPSVKAKTMVFIAVNATHKLQPAKELKLFDLRPLLAEAVTKARRDAEDLVAKMTATLSSS
jgi:hypothetical protein